LKDLFVETLNSIKNSYDDYHFFVERNFVWTVQQKLQEAFNKQGMLSVAFDMPEEILTTESMLFVGEEKVEEIEEEKTATEIKSKVDKQKIPAEFREACMERVGTYLQQTFIKESRVVFTTPDKRIKIVCLIASESIGSARYPYFWFGFRPKQKIALEKAEQAYLALGCGSEKRILLIPYNNFYNWLEGMNISGTTEKINHWNVVIFNEPGNLCLKTGQLNIDLEKYILSSKLRD